jgi:transposase
VPAAPREKNVPGEPPDHALGRSRGGFGTKLHLVVDRGGVPLAATLTPGEAHESRQVEPTLRRVRLPHRRTHPRVLAGDKGYSFLTVRRYLRRRGIRAVIPTRKDQRPHPQFDTQRYRQRNIIERVVGWCRRTPKFPQPLDGAARLGTLCVGSPTRSGQWRS